VVDDTRIEDELVMDEVGFPEDNAHVEYGKKIQRTAVYKGKGGNALVSLG
jgi:hypothetical protein